MPQISKNFKIVAHNSCPVQTECDTEDYAEAFMQLKIKNKNGKSVDKL